MGKGDIIKIAMSNGGTVIGIIATIAINELWFEMYLYNNTLSIYNGVVFNYEILDITSEEINLFKNMLLSKGYSYDDETKTIIHEL